MSKIKIKILSGWGHAGGSTIAFINLTNALNKQGIETVFYTPHQWHLDKCKADTTANMCLKEDDTFIIHFFQTNWVSRPPIKGKIIYSCHEKDIAPINSINYKIFDKIHYVSKPQMKWHNVDHPSFILPNILDDLKKEPKVGYPIAGIIGSIDRNKQTHISIKRAIKDACPLIYLFGKISDMEYYKEEVEPLIDELRVFKPEYEEDKQKMYNCVSDVYHSSLSETFGYIEKECELTGTIYHGNDATKGNFEKSMTNDEIIEEWKKELGYE